MSDEYEAAYEQGRREALEEMKEKCYSWSDMEKAFDDGYDAGLRDGESNARERSLDAEAFADLLRCEGFAWLEGVEVRWDGALRAILAGERVVWR